LTLTIAVLTGFAKVAEEADAKRRAWKKKQGKINWRLTTCQNYANSTAKPEQSYFTECSKYFSLSSFLSVLFKMINSLG